jgi:phenylacetate-CoA ligase
VFPLINAYAVLTRAERWSRADLDAYRDAAIHRLMAHCYEHVPYYRALMRERGLTPAHFTGVRDLARLPFLTKDDIRAQGPRLRSERHPDRVCQFRRSGGTTGEPVRVALDARARAFANIAYYRGFRWMGYRPGRPMLRLFGGSLGLPMERSLRSRLRESFLRTRFLPAFELSEATVHRYVEALEASRGGVLVGYTSVLMQLARMMEQQGCVPRGLASVICTAEMLPDQWRYHMAEIFRCPVYAYYGCGEVNSIGYERAGEQGYLVCQEHVVLEASDGADTDVREDGSGEFVVTTLQNYAMPLLRYRFGDRGTLAAPAGKRPWQRIVEIDGRVLDQLRSIGGGVVSGAFVPHLVQRSLAPVSRWQAVQDARDRIVFHFEPAGGDAPLVDWQARLSAVFQDYLGAGMRIEYVEGQFLETAARKHRFVVNLIPEGDS